MISFIQQPVMTWHSPFENIKESVAQMMAAKGMATNDISVRRS
jgi:hypothetical protein